ncbi:hypothetical protein AO735_08645 [Pseudomonas sp. TTU2014-096BSC]|nr:hypothetical protein AO735_08645 [Pseudomonas sp. TTU2014-096BSC]
MPDQRDQCLWALRLQPAPGQQADFFQLMGRLYYMKVLSTFRSSEVVNKHHWIEGRNNHRC